MFVAVIVVMAVMMVVLAVLVIMVVMMVMAVLVVVMIVVGQVFKTLHLFGIATAFAHFRPPLPGFQNNRSSIVLKF